MSNKSTVDLKSLGVLQDVRELKRNKNRKQFNESVNKIRREGKKREERYEERYKSGLENKKKVYQEAEKRTITNKSDLQNYKERLERANEFNPKREKLKKNLMKAGSKVETGINVGLERGLRALKEAGKKRVISRQVLKKNSMKVYVPDFKAPSILGDENRFFKSEYEKEKKNLFFS